MLWGEAGGGTTRRLSSPEGVWEHLGGYGPRPGWDGLCRAQLAPWGELGLRGVSWGWAFAGGGGCRADLFLGRRLWVCGEDPPGMNGGLGGLNSLLQKGS